MAGFGSIKRAADMQTGPIQHMRINHCGSDVFVPEQFLNATDVVPAFKQMRGDEWFSAHYRLTNSQFHHRMNLPNSVVRHVFSTVVLIFRCMAYIPVRFADHRNDRRLTEGQLLRSASVKRKPCGVQLKTVVRISHHCGFAGISQTTTPGLSPVTSCSAICKSPSSSTFSSTTRPVRANHLFSIPVRSDCIVKAASGPGQPNISDGVTA